MIAIGKVQLRGGSTGIVVVSLPSSKALVRARVLSRALACKVHELVHGACLKAHLTSRAGGGAMIATFVFHPCPNVSS